MFLVEVMGKDAGYIAMQTGIGSGAELIIIPEMPEDIEKLITTLQIRSEKKRCSSVIVVAEGSIEGGSTTIFNTIKTKLPNTDLRNIILGHVQRGGPPTAIDRLLGSRMGLAAIEALRNNKTNSMIGIVNNVIQHTPIEECITSKKPIADEEIMKMIRILRI